MRLLSWLLALGLLCVLAEHGAAAGDTPELYLTPNKAAEPTVLFTGSSYVVTCVSRSGEQMTWMGPDKNRVSEKGRVHVEGAKQTLSLVFSKLEKKDMGTYTCVSRIQGVERSVSFQLFVYVAINFVDTPVVQEVRENTSAFVKCEVEGDPEPTILWEVNGTSVAANPKYKVGGDGLFINNVTLDDGGVYKCQAIQLSQHISNMQQRSIHVKILHGPKAKNEEDVAYGFINGTKNLTCETSAEPPPKFKWMKNNVTITKDENVTIIKSKDRSVLQMIIQNSSYFGEYVCVASNKFGTLEQTILLKEGNKPEVPTFNIKGSTDDTVELDIESSNIGQLQIISYHVEYLPIKQGGVPNWNNANVVELQEPPFKIEGLMQDTKYMIRLAARNAAGLSDYTSEHSVTTASRETLPTSSSAQSMHLVCSSSYLLVVWCLFFKFDAFMVTSIQL